MKFLAFVLRAFACVAEASLAKSHISAIKSVSTMNYCLGTELLRLKGGICNEVSECLSKVSEVTSMSDVVLVINGRDDKFSNMLIEILEAKVASSRLQNVCRVK